MIVRLSELAQRDLDQSIRFYEAEAPNLGGKFYGRYLAAEQALAYMPRIGRVIESDIRKLKIRGFPFALFYRVHAGYAEVLRIADLRRDPDTWLR